MNELERKIIGALCSDNYIEAKRYVKILLEKNTTKKDEVFVKSNLLKLNHRMEELPANVSEFLIVENVRFNENRYYVSEREQEVLNHVLKMSKVSEKMKEMDINFVNSTILYGESGTGKTTFGRYLAYKLDVPFMYLNLSYVLSSYLGGTQKNISKVFDYVKKNKCVFMIDEVDAIGMRRSGSNEVGEMSRIVISLLQNIDMLGNDTLLLGATNRLDIIDEALLRRFTIKHEVLRLNEEERYIMAKRFLDDIKFSFDEVWLRNFVAPDMTQAELKNKIIMMLAEYLEE